MDVIDRVYADQVRQLYRLSQPGYLGTLINSSVLAFALWGVVPTAFLGLWLSAVFLVTGGRYLLFRAYRGLQPPDEQAPRWARYFTVGSGCAGLLWGVAGSALYPSASLPHQYLVIFLIGGMVMAGMVILAPVRSAFFAFMLPAVILIITTVLAQGTLLHFYMGALMIVFLLIVLSIVPIVSRMMRDALRVKFENDRLVQQLSEANVQLSERIGAQQRAEDVLRDSERRYRYMFEANPLPMWIRDEETLDILAVNEAAIRSYGYARDEFLRLRTADMHLPGDREAYLAAVRARDASQSYTSRWRHRRKDGSLLDVETTSYPFDLDGRAARLTLVNDITERVRAERRLHIEHQAARVLAEARTVEEALPQVMRTIGETGGWVYGARWDVDRTANVLRCADVWCAELPEVQQFVAFSRARTQVPGSGRGPIHRVWSTNAPVWIEDIERDGGTQRAQQALQAGLRSAFAFPILLGDTFYGVMEFFARETLKPDLALVELVQTIGSQIGQFMARKAAEQNLRFVASHDPLTGLFNRSIFHERLHQALAQAGRFGRTLSLLFIDLDGFKLINDTLGHNAGDALLVELANRLRATLREGDVIGRMGGDEFVVLIEESGGATQVAEVAKKIREAATRPFLLQGRVCQVTASIGISLYPDDGKDAQSLLKSADMAMYLVKQQGKNGFRFYSPEMNVHLMERLSLESGLRRALERGELLLLYQPKAGFAHPQVSGVEALLRWQHPTQGMISPAEFVPVAEDAGLIAAIGEWVLRTACQQLRRWREEGLPPLRMAVNLSSKQFLQDSLIQVVREALHNAAVEPSRLELEFTEEMVIRNPERAARLLAQLKELGVRVVIDDFGTGYSSLNYLKRLPIDCVKIDRSLILDLSLNPDAAALTRAVIAMAHSLGIAVTAEGVETREQWEFLNDLHCEEMQGSYFSAPVSPDIVSGIVQQAAPGRRGIVQALRPRRDSGDLPQ